MFASSSSSSTPNNVAIPSAGFDFSSMKETHEEFHYVEFPTPIQMNESHSETAASHPSDFNNLKFFHPIEVEGPFVTRPKKSFLPPLPSAQRQESLLSIADEFLDEMIRNLDKEDAFEPIPIVSADLLGPAQCPPSGTSTSFNCWDLESTKIQHPFPPQLEHHRHQAPENGPKRIVVSDVLKSSTKKHHGTNKKKNLRKKKQGLEARPSSLFKCQHSPKFRVYQKEKWWERYDELVEYFNRHGHSQVVNIEKENKELARWVKRQRYQYRLATEGQPSSMTKERIDALDKVKFVWDSHEEAWEDHLKELEDFKAKHKHCNVPSTYPENRSLASWVKCQRRQYRLYEAGEESNITMDRINRLEKMGFRWSLRTRQKR